MGVCQHNNFVSIGNRQQGGAKTSSTKTSAGIISHKDNVMFFINFEKKISISMVGDREVQ